MPSDKRNSITAKATGLISSLFNVASARDVPFRQLQQLQCICHGATFVLLKDPLYLFPYSSTTWVTICGTRNGFSASVMASVQDLKLLRRFLHYSLLEMLCRCLKYH